MQNTFWTALSTSLVSAFVTCLGIYTIRRCTAWGQRNITYFMCFAAGVLISASFLHIIPKSLAMTPEAPVWLLVGFFGLHLFNRFLTSLVCEKDPEKKDFVIGIIPMFGIGLHSLIDGVIYSIAFTVSILTGFLATLGMVLHEFPEGIITYLLLVRSGFAKRNAMRAAFVAAAATTPIGMLISYPFISRIEQNFLGALRFASAYQGKLVTETMLIEGVNDDKDHLHAVAEFLERLCPRIAYLSIPTRPPAESWVCAPDEGRLNDAYHLLSEKVHRVEYLIGYEGNAFASTGDAEQDLLSITAVHPMRQDAVSDYLARTGAKWDLIRRLVEKGELVETPYGGHAFYLRKLRMPGKSE